MTRIHEKGEWVTEEWVEGQKAGKNRSKCFKRDHSDIGMTDHKINSGSKPKRGGGETKR